MKEEKNKIFGNLGMIFAILAIGLLGFVVRAHALKVLLIPALAMKALVILNSQSFL